MMHISKYNVLALALLFCCAPGFAQRNALNTEESAALRAKVTANTKSLQSLQSDFIQTKKLSYTDKAIRSTGKFYFKAPGKIRWEYLSPSSYVVVFDGQTMHTKEGGRTRSTNLATNRRTQGLNELLVSSLQEGDMLGGDRFATAYFRDKTDYIAVLTPKDKRLSSYIRQVELVFDGTSLLLTRVTLTDPRGDSTQLAFTGQRKNETIPDATFRP